MRKRAQVKQQLKQVTYRHLQKLLRDNFKQRPDTCCFNREVILDEDSRSSVFLCSVTSPSGQPRNVVCDSRVGGCAEMARECPLWAPLKTKQLVKDQFNEVIQSGNRGLIASEYPDIAALLWVLDDPEGDAVPSEEEIDKALKDAGDVEHQAPSQGWSWKGWFRNIGGG